MNTLSKFLFFTIVVSGVPFVASAHAVPVDTVPVSGEVSAGVPANVVVTFSERIDISASTLLVTGPSGQKINVGKASASEEDPRTITVPIISDGNGAYVVSWSAISSDDGHFTRGTYPFAVGTSTVLASSDATSEMVQIATMSEVLGMTVELFGHGVLWALLLLFLFAVRPLLVSGKFEAEKKTIFKGYVVLTGVALVLAFVGGLFQFYTKTSDLALLQTIPMLDAFTNYLGTTAGFATVGRILSIVGIGIVFLFAKRKIFESKKITIYEILIFLLLCCFAFLRAKVSHATANPFFPEFSIVVNFFHLIEKDIWAGIVGILAVIALVPRLRAFLGALVPKAFTMLAIDFAFVSVTACYIVWLHLKSFDNVFTTAWGAAFIKLLLAAVLLVACRFYHVIARAYFPKHFSTWLPFTLAKEFACALLVIFASSAIIITSPPLAQSAHKTLSETNQSVTITLLNAPYEDAMAQIVTPPSTLPPRVTILNTSLQSTPIAVPLIERFAGGYVFPKTFLQGSTTMEVSVIAPQDTSYDARVSFSVEASDFPTSATPAEGRTFDAFTLSMVLCALGALLVSFLLLRISSAPSELDPIKGRLVFPELFSFATSILTLFIAGNALVWLGSSSLINPFKAECVRDGNMWHLMLPQKAGVVQSMSPREGCMWGMGKYQYLFADKREYEYAKPKTEALTTFTYAPRDIQTGVPVTLQFSITEQDGTPAKLFVDMEKLIHIVVVSADQTSFAHVHPDDFVPLTKEAIDTSTFSYIYTFPKAGTYLVSVNYAHGTVLESKQFKVQVSGSPIQKKNPTEYPSQGNFGGYDVSLKSDVLIAGEVTTLRYTLTKDGKPVTNLVPYLAGAMHIAAVKNDLSSFMHIHGEVHPPGVPIPPVIVRDGKIIHSLAMMNIPSQFPSPVDAHIIFPTPGLYTLWGQFKVGDTVIPSSFTVQVQ